MNYNKPSLMNCPHCELYFEMFLANGTEMPEKLPVLCEACGQISICILGEIRKMTTEEMDALKGSEAWSAYLGPIFDRLAWIRRAQRSAVNN